jgi:hypothetical protein
MFLEGSVFCHNSCILANRLSFRRKGNLDLSILVSTIYYCIIYLSYCSYKLFCYPILFLEDSLGSLLERKVRRSTPSILLYSSSRI